MIAVIFCFFCHSADYSEIQGSSKRLVCWSSLVLVDPQLVRMKLLVASRTSRCLWCEPCGSSLPGSLVHLSIFDKFWMVCLVGVVCLVCLVGVEADLYLLFVIFCSALPTKSIRVKFWRRFADQYLFDLNTLKVERSAEKQGMKGESRRRDEVGTFSMILGMNWIKFWREVVTGRKDAKPIVTTRSRSKNFKLSGLNFKQVRMRKTRKKVSLPFL